MTASILESLDIQYIDHLAITTNDLMGTLDAYMRLPGTRLVRGPGDNPTQGVQFAFVRLSEGWILKILVPRGDSQSPIASHVAGGGGPYHFCFAVKALDASVSAAMDHGAKLVVAPVEDVAFDGRRVAFLYHPLVGLFELVEAMPPSSAHQPAGLAAPPTQPAAASGPGVTARHLNPEDLDRRLESVFAELFPNTPAAAIRALEQGGIPEWSSLGHLMLIMKIEREFGVAIPAEAVAKLNSFATVLTFLEEFN